MRTFISVELPDKIKKNIDKLIKEFRSNLTPIKWVNTDNLHLTLKFLGEVPENKIDTLFRSVEFCIKDIKPFQVSIEGVGTFPDANKPKVLWVGINEGSEMLTNIAEYLEDRMAKDGFREKEHDFNSHVTIGRIKEKVDIKGLADHINKKGAEKIGSFKADHVSIMESTLTQKGPIYREIKSIYFGK